jgi:hypothetical protein
MWIELIKESKRLRLSTNAFNKAGVKKYIILFG